MTSRTRAAALAAVLTVALAIPVAADAGTLKLSCAGKGARNKDSAGTVLCAGNPAKGRTITGTVRNDAGQPVAAKVVVTISSWTVAPNGIGYTV